MFRLSVIGFLIALVQSATAAAYEATNLWEDNVGYYYSESSPAVNSDGTIYVGTWDCKFLSISSNGLINWSYSTDADIRSSPAIAADGTIYFGCRDRRFYALTVKGKLKWSITTGG